ncbi:MAG: HAD family hydrolase [Phycisphaerae bacterium]
MKYDAVIFDLYGTLVPGYPKRASEVIQTRIAEAIGVDVESFRQLWQATYPRRAAGEFEGYLGNVRFICQELAAAPTREQLSEAERIRMAAIRDSLQPKDGSAELVRRIRQAGYRTGLVSDCTCEIPECWPETPFAELIEAPIFSATAGVKKPDPAIYLMCTDKLDVQPERCLFVGDGGSNELSGARNVGMDAVLVREPYEDSYEPQRPDVESWTGPSIGKIHELGEWLEL